MANLLENYILLGCGIQSSIMACGCKWDNMSHTRLLLYYFWQNIPGIFLEYSFKMLEKIFSFLILKSYYCINVHVKNLAKNVIVKKIEIQLQVLLLFKGKHYGV